jgi:hypothetical protein
MNLNSEFPTDELGLLQLRVARRADELVRDSKVATPLNLHCWLIAEGELINDADVSDASPSG